MILKIEFPDGVVCGFYGDVFDYDFGFIETELSFYYENLGDSFIKTINSALLKGLTDRSEQIVAIIGGAKYALVIETIYYREDVTEVRGKLVKIDERLKPA